jgi:RNA polymerase sigma-70 factor (ECF subfamily)
VTGAEQAWLAEVYREYHDKVLGYCHKKFSAQEDAEEMCAEVFAEAVRAAGRYDPARASPSTWIYAITRNLVNRRLRDRYRRRETPLDTDEIAQDAGDLERFVARDSLAGALKALSRDKRNVVMLSFYYGYSPREIAERLGLSYSNVCALKSRALSELEKALSM